MHTALMNLPGSKNFRKEGRYSHRPVSQESNILL